MSISLIQPFPYNLVSDDDSDIVLTNFVKVDMPYAYTVSDINKAKIKNEKCETFYFGNSLDFEDEIEDEDKIFNSSEYFSSNNGQKYLPDNFYENNKDIDTYKVNDGYDEDEDFDYDDDVFYELLRKLGYSTFNPLFINFLKPMFKVIKSYSPSRETIRDMIYSNKQTKSREINNITTVNRIDESLFKKLSSEEIERFNWYGYPMNDVNEDSSNNQVKIKLKLKPKDQYFGTSREVPIANAIVDENQFENNSSYFNPNKLLIDPNESKSNLLFQNREINYTNDFDSLNNYKQSDFESNGGHIIQSSSPEQKEIITSVSREVNLNENSYPHPSLISSIINNEENENSKPFPTIENEKYHGIYNESFINSVKKLNEIDNQSCSSSNSSPKNLKTFQELPESPINNDPSTLKTNKNKLLLKSKITNTQENKDSKSKSKSEFESGSESGSDQATSNSLSSLHNQNLSDWQILDKLSSDILEKNKTLFENEENIIQFNKKFNLSPNGTNSVNKNENRPQGKGSNEITDGNLKIPSNSSSSVTEFNENELLDYNSINKSPVYSIDKNNEAQYINDELKEKLKYSQQINQQYLNEIEEESNKRKDLESKLTKSVNEVKEYTNVITDMEGLIKDYSTSLNVITTIKSNLFKLEQEANNLKKENVTLKEKHKQDMEELEKEKNNLIYLLNQYKFKESSEIDSSSDISVKSVSSTSRRRNSFDDNILNKRKEIEKIEGNINENRKSIILFNEQIEFKENEIINLKDSLDEHNKKINSLEEQINQKDKEILNLQDLIKKSNEERQRELQNMMKVEIPENSISLDEYECLKQQHDEQKSQLNDYIDENKNLQEQQKEQKQKLEEYIKENESLIDNINKEKNINNDLKKKNISLNKSVEEIQQKFDNLYKEYKNKQKEYNQSISNFNEEKKSNQKLESQINELNKQLKTEKNMVQKTKNDYKAILEKLNQTQEKINAKEKEKETLKTQLKKEKKEKVQSETKWKNVLKELESEKEAKMKSLNTLENEKKLRLQSIKELEIKQSEINTISKENKAINSKISKLEKEYDNMKDQNNILNEKYQNLMETNQKEINEKEEIKQKYDDFVKEYQEKLDAYHKLEEELKQKSQLYQEEKQGYDQTISQLESKLNETESNIQEKESQLNDLKKQYELEIEQYKQNEKQYDSEIEKFKQNEKQYDSEIEKLKQNEKQFDSEIEKYKQNEKKLKSVIKIYKKNSENQKIEPSNSNAEISKIKYEEIQRSMEQSKKDLELSQEEIDLLKNKLKEEQDNSQKIQEDYDQLLEKYKKETENKKDNDQGSSREVTNNHTLEVMKTKLKQFIQREQLFQKKIQKLSQQLQLEKKSREQAEQKCKEFEAKSASGTIGNEGVSKIKMEELERVVEQSKKDQQLLLEEIDLLRSMLKNN